MQFDHIVIATVDPVFSARRLAETTGLVAVEGGVHDWLGTFNYIVPLGRGYLELVGVHDEQLAAQNPFGQLVGSALARHDESLAGWAVEVDRSELISVAGALGTPIDRLTRGGVGIDHVGMATAIQSPGLPFLLARTAGAAHPEAMATGQHRVTPLGVASVEIGESRALWDQWLGDPPPELDVHVEMCTQAGDPGIATVRIDTADGPIILTAAQPTAGVQV